MNTKKDRSSTKACIQGPTLINPKIYNDSRGFFMESWNQERFNSIIGKEITFVQDNHSYSKRCVLRGLHYQINPQAQGKLVRCISGEIFDVAVDIRKNSKTFGKWIGYFLNSENHLQFWIPEGFAHGFLTTSNSAEVLYKTTAFWSKSHERSLRWDDPSINIIWPKDTKDIKVSEKDSSADLLLNVDPNLLFE